MKTPRFIRRWGKKQWRRLQSISHAFNTGVKTVWTRLTQFETVVVEQGEHHFRVRKPSTKNYFNPLFWIQQCVQFAIRYNKSRSLSAFLHGLPVLLTLCLAVAGYYWMRPNQSRIVGTLKTERNLAADAGDFERADFFARKLCFAQNNNPQSLFDRALLLHRFDKTEEARALAIQLANNSDFFPALEWLCQIDLTKFQDESEAVSIKEYESVIDRLIYMLNRNEGNPKTHVMLGTVFMQMNDFTRAEAPLRRATELLQTTPAEIWWSLSIIASNTGDKKAAREYADRAADGFLKNYANQRTVDAEKILLSTVKALVAAEREEEATRLLKASIAQREGREAARQAYLLCDVYALWAKRLRTTRSSDLPSLALAVQHLKTGLAILPNQPALVEELGKFACSPEGTTVLPEEKLLRLMDSGISPGLIHFILGTRLADKGAEFHDEALRHLKRAMSHDNKFPGLMNNLANAMAGEAEPDLKYALSLVELALETMPDQPYFFDTRGKILVRLGQFEPAIADFERALTASELRSTLHEQLADVYEKIGDEKSAKRHHDLAESLSPE